MKACGQLNLEQPKRKLAKRPDLARVGSEFSTWDILTKELFLIRTVNAGVEAVAPVVHRYDPSSRLGPDQRKALAHLPTIPDQFTGFRGLAGSGKTTVLVELARLLRNEGFTPVFCGPTASATHTHRKESLRTATMTLPKLLGDPNARATLSSRSVIVLDEAGAVGLDDMLRLFEVARLRDCRVILRRTTSCPPDQ